MIGFLASPGGANSPTVKEQPIPIPPGGLMITQLASYICQVHGCELAMRCRKCGVRFEGPAVSVHEQMRAHHDVVHPVAVVAKPAAPAPVKRARVHRAPREPKPPRIVAPPTPCEAPDCTVMVQQGGTGPRRRYCSLVCRGHAKAARMKAVRHAS